jgi:hypothetical protein
MDKRSGSRRHYATDNVVVGVGNAKWLVLGLVSVVS